MTPACRRRSLLPGTQPLPCAPGPPPSTLATQPPTELVHCHVVAAPEHRPRELESSGDAADTAADDGYFDRAVRHGWLLRRAAAQMSMSSLLTPGNAVTNSGP